MSFLYVPFEKGSSISSKVGFFLNLAPADSQNLFTLMHLYLKHFPLLLDFFQLPHEFETGMVLVAGSFF